MVELLRIGRMEDDEEEGKRQEGEDAASKEQATAGSFCLPTSWALLKQDLATFIRAAPCDGGVQGWLLKHDRWRATAAAVAEKLGGTRASATVLHARMGRYYASLPRFLGGTSLQRGNQVCNTRALLLPLYHLAHSGCMWQE